MVIGGNSCPEGRGFESLHQILDGHFSHTFVVKIDMFVWKDENKMKKRSEVAHFFKKYISFIMTVFRPEGTFPFSKVDIFLLKWTKPDIFSTQKLNQKSLLQQTKLVFSSATMAEKSWPKNPRTKYSHTLKLYSIV